MKQSKPGVLTIVLAHLSIMLWPPATTAAMARHEIKKQAFGMTDSGEPVEIYTLTNANGMEARIMTYGGTVVSLKTPDRHGTLGDVVLGYDLSNCNISDEVEQPKVRRSKVSGS